LIQKKVLILMSTLSIFSFVICAFDVVCKKPLPNSRPWRFTFMFSFKSFIALISSYIYIYDPLELIFKIVVEILNRKSTVFMHFQMCNTVLLNLGKTLFSGSLELVYFAQLKSYLHCTATPIVPSLKSPKTTLILYIYEADYFRHLI
jgi:hypothetical protein